MIDSSNNTHSRPGVCHVVHSLNVGGAEILASALAANLRDRYRVSFACLDEAGAMAEQVRDAGYPLVVLDRRPGVDRACRKRLRDFFLEEQVDIVHAHQYTPFFYSLLARGWRSQPRIIFTEHGRHYPDVTSVKRRLFNRMMLGRGDRVVGVGGQVKQAIVEKESIAAARVRLIYNGVDLSRFEDAGDGGAIRQELDLSTDAFVITMVCRLDPLKDIGTAVEAFHRVHRESPHARLVIVGDGPERAMIESHIAELKLQDTVTLLGLRRDVPAILAGSDLLLQSSISEGIPLTVIEAMAAGVPVVATDVGGLHEMIDDGEQGLLAPARAPEQLAACIGRIIHDDNLRDSLVEAARRRAQEMFSEQQMVSAYDALYREVLHD